MPSQAEANLSALIESTEDLVWSVGLDYCLTTINSALRRNFQNTFGVELAMGTCLHDFLPPERRALWPPFYERALKEGPFRVEYPMLDGRTLELAMNPIIVDGKATGVSVFGKDITERKTAEMKLRESEERYRATFEQAAVGIVHVSFEGRITSCNARFAEIVGYPLEEVCDMTFQQITPAEYLAGSIQALETLMSGVNNPASWEKPYRRKDGTLRWARLTSSVQRDGDGKALKVITIVEDIHARKQAENDLHAATTALLASESRYRTVFHTVLDSVSISRLGDGRYIDVNQAFLDTTGFARDEVIGKTASDLRFWDDPGKRESVVDILRQKGFCRDVEARFRGKNGDLFWGVISASVIELDNELCFLRDVSDAKEAADTIRDLAFYDPLTHLPNRRLLLDRLQQTLVSSARSQRNKALLFVDLDNFKTLNDTLGHQTGDLLLQEVALRLSSCVREFDTVARLGGDEFVVMLEDLSQIPEEAAAQAESVAEKILAAVDQPYMLDGRKCLSTSSIGITVFGDKRESTNEVLQQADIAMYQAKSAGRNAMRFFAPALQAAVNARVAMEEELRQAIKIDEFVMYYQPQVKRSRLIGVEALIRWNHPVRGLLFPGEFISTAEESGLIIPLGDWVLETACAQIASWSRRKGTSHLSISVNISARQFREPGFAQQVLAAIERTGANPKNLRLELTESMLVDNIEDVIAKMNLLKSHGLRFSLDDFGTGYSSLAYLRRLPLDQLKIDRSFVRDILTDLGSRAIAQTIISLGRALNLSVIAEGVELEDQRETLSHIGCHSFQGYLFSKPLPLEEFQRLWLDSVSSGAQPSSGL
jgi:diguanylate cyclase (GGDEF)-like protein/PAS domain S-box-containing protein